MFELSYIINTDRVISCSSNFLSIVIGETISPWERKVINPLYTCCPARPLNTSAGLYHVIPQLDHLLINYSFSKAETQSFDLDKISIVSIYLTFFDNHRRRVGVCFI